MSKKTIWILILLFFCVKLYKFDIGFDCCLLDSSSPPLVVSHCANTEWDQWRYYFIESREYLKNKCKNMSLAPTMLYIDSENPIILDNKTYFLKHFNRSISGIYARNVKGFDLNFNWYDLEFYRKYRVDLCRYDMAYSELQLYHNGKIYEDKCDLETIKHLTGLNNSHSYLKIPVEYTWTNYIRPFKYYQNTCAYIFMNYRGAAWFYDIKNSLLEKNQLGFLDLYDGHKLADLNCTVTTANFGIYRVNLGYGLINRQIFKETEYIYIKGVIGSVDSDFDLFNSFKKLEKIMFSIRNHREFFETNTNWLKRYINNNESKYNDFKNKSNIKKVIFSKAPDASSNDAQHDFLPFSDDEFCLFANYPINKTILYVPAIRDNIENCTCTMAYLVQNYYMMSDETFDWHSSDLIHSNIFTVCFRKINKNQFLDLVKRCDYDERIKYCNKQEILGLSEFSNKIYYQLNKYDLVYHSKLVKFVFVIISHPINCILGVISNLVIILVLEKRKKLNTASRSSCRDRISQIKLEIVFEYIQLNAFTNLLACILFSFQPIIDCIDYTSPFCSRFYFTQFGKNFYIYFINFIGTALKISSSFTTLMFSTARFLMITQQNSLLDCIPFFKVKPKLALILIFLISLLLSVSKIFFNEREYYVLGPLLLYNLKTTSWDNSKLESDYSKLVKKYNVINIANFIFNDVVIISLIVLIDCLILCRIKSVKSKLNNHSKGVRLEEQQQEANKSQPSSVETKQSKLNKLIIYNGLFQLLFKLPDMIFNILITFHHYDRWASNLFYFCDVLEIGRENSACLNLLQSANSFYILSFSLDFILLYKYNSQFRSTLPILFHSKRNKNILA